jgi:hypothetical protein
MHNLVTSDSLFPFDNSYARLPEHFYPSKGHFLPAGASCQKRRYRRRRKRALNRLSAP